MPKPHFQVTVTILTENGARRLPYACQAPDSLAAHQEALRHFQHLTGLTSFCIVECFQVSA